MDEKRYLVEVILRARDSMTQVAQKVAASLNDVSKAQQKVNDASARASAPLRQQVSDLEKLVEAHTREKRALEESSRSLRSTATARRAAADASRKQLEELQRQARVERAQATEREKRDIEEIRRLRLSIAERVASGEKKTRAFNRETREMREQAALLEALNRESAAGNQRRAAELGVEIAQIQSGVTERNRAATKAEQAAGKQERAFNSVSKSVDRHNTALNSARAALERTEGSFGRTEASASRMGRVFESMRRSTNNARSGLRGLNAEFQGFQIALMIKYAQSLISAMVALGAQLFAVAAAAAQAAAGIGAALAAGAAQAVPVIGVLAAAFSRLTSVLKIVKLQNQQQLTATHDSTRAAKAHQTATDQIRSAEQRVADAHRNTTQAVRDLSRTRSDAARQELQDQQAVNQARRDAVRTVEDLKAAEEDAIRSLDSARANRQRAVESGDVAGTVQADVDVTRARRDVRRTRQDAAPVRARGVEGVQAVQQAEQQLADTRRQGARQIQQAEQRLGEARRSERQATDDLSRTRRESADNLAQETAAADKLTDSLRQLSPAERELYRRILVLQGTYRRIARPITDIITRAFTGVVDRVNSLLQDPRIVRGFRNIATQIAASIRTATREAGGQRSIGAFQILSSEATRNIPIATRIIINFFRAVRNLVLDAVPAFRLLLRYIEGYSNRALDASRNSRGISDFFVTGVRYARSFLELGLAVVRLFLALAGRGGAAGEGIRTINDLTGAVDGLTDKANHNAESIRRFFRSTHDAVFEILGVIGNLAKVMLDAFSPSSIKAFADFLNGVIIPALGTVVRVMGAMVTVFHQAFSLPGVAQVAQMAATMLLLARGLTIIRTAIGSIMQIMPNFLRAMGLMAAAEEGAAAGAAAVTPFGWVVIGVGAAIAAIILLDQKLHFLAPTWRFIKRVAIDAWDGIKAGAESVMRWFSDVWTQGLLYWIRWPFVWLARHAGGPAFRWIINAAKDVIDWLTKHFGPGGDFAIIGDLIAFPFRYGRAAIKLTFDVIKTIIEGALDLIAGRFDRFGTLMGDFWANFLDVGRGAISSLLGIVGDLLGALGKIPKIGGPFKDAANDVRNAQHKIDDLRDSTKKHRQEQKRSDDVVKDSLPNLVSLRDRYKTATDRLDRLTPGTKAFRDATHDARDASRRYNDALKDTADKAGGARQPVGKLRGNIKNLGDVSADTADVVAKNLNDVLRQVGARTIRLNTRAYRRSGIDQMTEVTGHGATGGALSRAHGLRRRMWGGGMPNPYGGAADDHVLFSPSGAPVAALSGTEGIVNRPQMGVIDQALNFTQNMTGMPWGSLNDLWGSGMRHFQGGGGLQPAIRNLSNRLDRMFDLTTTSGYRTSMPLGHPDLHNAGLAADISGTPQAMARATRYIKSSGIWRSLLEGIHNPGLSVKNSQMVPASFWGADTWAKHMDHIHIAVGRAVRAIMAQVRMPLIQGLGNDALSRIARGGAQTMTRAANRYLRRQMARQGGGDPKAMGADANVVAAFRRAMRDMRASPKERLAGWEAGIVESGLKNLHYGDRDSLGSLQERAGIFGRAHALNPYASMVRFLRDAISKRPWRGSAGALAQAVQRSAYPSKYDEVRSRAQRYMQTGGPIRGTAGPTTGGLRPFPRPPRPVNLVTRSLNPILEQVNASFRDVTTVLEATARGPLRRSKRLVRRIANAFERITGDNGLLDQMRAQIETITARGARALQQRQFRVTRQGPRRRAFTEAQVAQGTLRGLQGERGAIQEERSTIEDSIEGAQRSLAEARRRGNARARRAARAALRNLRVRLDANTTALAQNAQDQVEAQETFQQALLTTVNDAADRQNNAVDRWSRMAKALGQKLDPNVILGAQVTNMRNQIGGLQGVLAQARRTGNTTLANQVADQIADLNVQIQEAVAQQFQNSIDAVNNAAQQRTARLDRQTRIAQLGGQTNFASMQNILGQRGDVLRDQRAGLLGLLGMAQRAGNAEQVDNLVDQIDELNTQLAENTQAIQDNTDAAFDFRTQQVNDAFGFSQNVFQGAQGFFQALTERTGINTIPQQLATLQGIATALQTQSQGLTGQLATLIGDPTARNLSGPDLVQYLLSISSGPAFDAIMARLDPTQENAFRDLVTALLGNATAVEANTKAVNDLTNPGAQSFASTLWSTFRQAVFTGAGGLLPQYQMTVPSGDVGARVLSSGVMLVHAGEAVKPASVSHAYGDSSGDVYTLNVTTPTQVLNPTDVARQLAFYRKAQGRR